MARGDEMRAWYYVIGDEKKGPVPEKELIALLKSCELSSDTLVWTEGMEAWTQVGDAEALTCSSPDKVPQINTTPPERDSLPVEVVEPEVIDPDGKKKKREVPQVRPWVRYWARMIDFNLFFFAYGLLLIFIAPLISVVRPLLFLICAIVGGFFVEAGFLSLWGTTPGKWLMQVRVRKHNGEKLTYSGALGRAFSVWMRGEGFSIPIVSLFTHLTAYNRLREKGITSWDENGQFTVSHRRIGFFRALLATVILLFFNGLLSVFGDM